MFSLVSRKFLAMRNITLYSVLSNIPQVCLTEKKIKIIAQVVCSKNSIVNNCIYCISKALFLCKILYGRIYDSYFFLRSVCLMLTSWSFSRISINCFRSFVQFLKFLVGLQIQPSFSLLNAKWVEILSEEGFFFMHLHLYFHKIFH